MELFENVNVEYIDAASSKNIYPKYKVELLDFYESIIMDITEYIDADSDNSISVNYQQGVRRTCSLTLIDSDGKIMNSGMFLRWLNYKIKIYVGLYNIKSGNIFWFSQGIFYIINPTVNRLTKTITIEGVDKYGFLGSETGYNQITSTYIIPYDTSLKNAISDTLMLDIGNGKVIDSKSVHINPSLISEKSPYDIKKSPSTYLSDIFIEIGNIFGADTYYNTNGNLCYDIGTEDVSYSTLSSIWDFSDNDFEYLDSILSVNTVDIVNSVTISSNNSDSSAVYTYTAENHNYSSNTSIENIGRKEYYEESSFVYNDDTAKDYAKYVLNQKTILQNSINITCPLLPHLDVNKVITITDNYYNFSRNRFIIQSLNIPLNSKNTMTITASNVSSLPYYEFTGSSS